MATVFDDAAALHSRLEAYFARPRAGRSVRSLGPLVALTGGWASSLYTFTVELGEPSDVIATTLVLKLYAPDARGREHALREWRALTQLRSVDLAVPGVVLVEPDARPLGRPFIVMDHIGGTSFWQAFEAAGPVRRTGLTRSFTAQLVDLHALDPHLLDDSAAPWHPYSYIDQELAQLHRDSADSPHAALAEVVRWLQRRRQAASCERPAILHRDYHPWNVLVDAAERLWVIDWDWQVGDARFDLAWTCMLMRRSGFHEFSSAVRGAYARQSDRPLDDFAYFEVLTTVRWLLNVLPAVGPDAPVDAAAQADFRAFLREPVRQAQMFLAEHTGIDVDIRLWTAAAISPRPPAGCEAHRATW